MNFKKKQYKIVYSKGVIFAHSYNNAIEIQNDLVNNGDVTAHIIIT